MCDIPVHCVIESLGGANKSCLSCTSGGESSGCRKLSDSYAFVSGHTKLSKLKDCVLAALGFDGGGGSRSAEIESKGLVIIDNWKPLTFDQITDDPDIPVEALFKQLGGNRWTLKIILASPHQHDYAEEKNNCKQQPTIPSCNERGDSRSGSPDEVPDSSFRGLDPPISSSSITIDRSSNRLFFDWYTNFLPRYHPYLTSSWSAAAITNRNADNIAKLAPEPSSSSIAAFMANRLTVPVNNDDITPSGVVTSISPNRHYQNFDHGSEFSGSDDVSVERRSSTASSPKFHPYNLEQEQQLRRRSVLVSPQSSVSRSSNANNTSHVGQQSMCRLMFDLLTELPLLSEWYQMNTHPTPHDIQRYTDILNSKQYRKTYPKVSTHNVKIWFKNRRAKSKRVR